MHVAGMLSNQQTTNSVGFQTTGSKPQLWPQTDSARCVACCKLPSVMACCRRSSCSCLWVPPERPSACGAPHPTPPSDGSSAPQVVQSSSSPQSIAFSTHHVLPTHDQSKNGIIGLAFLCLYRQYHNSAFVFKRKKKKGKKKTFLLF